MLRTLRYMTAGESHGPMLVGILEGMPAGLALADEDLSARLRRRQGGYGRGQRMQIETDAARIVGGTWKGKTTGAPLAMLIENRSSKQWRTRMRRTVPRPGHADLAGMLKYGFDDANPVIERASARETAMRTALGAAACHLLERLGVRLTAHVVAIGGIEAPRLPSDWGPAEIEAARDASEVACCDPVTSAAMTARIDEARAQRQSLGGRTELIVWNLPPGLGSYVHWDRRLDARLAAMLLSIPSAKAIELGDAISGSAELGAQAQDVIARKGRGIFRPTNRAGGLEGGVTNGQPLVVRVTHKPIPTQRRPLPTVDLDDGQPVEGRYVRSDVAIVPAAAVIAEALAGMVLVDAALEKFGSDRFAELERAWQRYLEQLPQWDESRS
ncbi:MAG: chorismate synthase [Acidobacteriota bacterium]|nr:MAG: chorismate synthase [Acidobacteriota bacterium]